jgi:molybdopterin-biosynthesis enzyme MoeA-like protein
MRNTRRPPCLTAPPPPPRWPALQNEARLRMATLPQPCEVLFTPGLWVPLVVAGGNVHVLPGIPRLFRAMVEAHVGRFRGPASHAAELLTAQGEGDLAAPLAEVAAAHPSVRIGSYPNTDWDMQRPAAAGEWRVRLVFEGRDAAAVGAAAAAAREVIPTLPQTAT